MRAERRLRDRLGASSEPGPGADPDVLAVVVAGLVLALLWAVAGPLVAVPGAVVTALVGRRLTARLPDPAVRAQLVTVSQQLPLALELLASTLSAGVTPREAAGHVGRAVRGLLGDRLARVERDGDWTPLADLGHPVTDRLVGAVARSAASGAPLEPWVLGLAADLRSQAGPRAEEAARSAGAWAVLPLGLCFLPAYLLLGVVPCLLGLARRLT